MFKKILLSSLLIYTIVGFFVLPYILKPQIIQIVEKETNSKLYIKNIYFNPFIFNLKISGIKLKSLDSKPLVSLKSIKFDLELYSLFNSTIHIKQFVLEEPKISIIYEKNKSLNLLKIFKPSEKSTESDSKSELSIPRILIDRIAIVKGKVDYEDYSHKTKFDFSFNDIGFEVKDIDTDKLDTPSAKLRFYTTLGDGGFVDLRGETLGMKPLKMKGNLNFEASKLYTQWRYLQDNLNLEVADGKLALYADYNFNLDSLDDMMIENYRFSLEKLRIKPKNQYNDVFYLNNFSLNGATIKPFKNYVHISEIDFDSMDIKVKRDENGKVNWLEYIKQNNTNIDDSNKSSDSNVTKWDVRVDNFSLKKLKVNFEDSAIKPSVTTNLNELNLYFQNITFAGVEPISYKMDMFLNKDFRCSSQGDVKHKILDLKSYTKCDGLNLTHYRPYIDDIATKSLKKYNIKLKSSTIGFDANMSLNDVDSKTVAIVNDANLYVDNFAINKKSTNEPLLRFNIFNLNGVKFNSGTKEIVIDKSSLETLKIKTSRLKNGTLNIDDLVVLKRAKKIVKTKNSLPQKPYNIRLKSFALKSAKVDFNDKLLTPSVKSKLDRINLNLYDIDSKKYSWLNYNLSMRVNSKGYINTKGSLRHTPLKQNSKLELKRISLVELNPYIQQKAFVSIEDGYLNLKTKIKYAKSNYKPDLVVKGSLNLEEFLVYDSRDDTTILAFNNLNLKSLNLEQLPNKLYVDELDIDGFYVDAIVDENKTLNFATLVKNGDKKDVSIDKKSTDSKSAFPMKIMKTNITNGNAKFADLSLPIKFTTDIHDLNGVIYMISNEASEISYIDILGEVDRYGSTKLKGSINSSNPKAYTDINFNFRNLELSSYSGYSASFAGYKIDSGKLYLDLGYNILDSQLLSTNSVMIKNITLGRAVTKDTLPIGFVIALLEDSDGVIDVNMPVEGDLDQPDFKYGKLVVKTLGNLVVKAVTSPFRFLGSMMGINGEDLESLDFGVGEMVILPPEKEKLDTIAKIMTKRPKINLLISPVYDLSRDRLALQKQKLASLVVLRGDDKNKHENSMSIEILEDIYEEFRDDDKLDEIKDDLEEKYKGEILDRAYLIEVLKECVAVQVVKEEELKYLAIKRAEVLKEYLVDEKMIKLSRVAIGELDIIDDDGKWVKTKLGIGIK